MISDKARFEKWVALSRCVQGIEPFMMVAIQGLGRLDAELATADHKFLQMSEEERIRFQVENPLELADRVTRSYLWVLGAYEIVRALDQRCRSGVIPATEAQRRRAREAKHRFERIRMPLAKFETARRHADTDSPVAFPALHVTQGVAWRVAADAFVTREELAQDFRSLLEEFSDGA
ncbi:MAG TPA: hypothetical protein VIN61_16290 [Gammaproteobacteria bacterium]